MNLFHYSSGFQSGVQGIREGVLGISQEKGGSFIFTIISSINNFMTKSVHVLFFIKSNF